MQTDAQAESSTAVVEAPVSDLSKWTPEERQTWRSTGEIPKPKEEKPAPSKESEKPSEAKEETKAETAPAPEAGQEQEPKSGKRSTAETRLQEILADLRKAGLSPAELKTFKREAKAETKAEPSPAPKAEELPKRPSLANWSGTLEEFDAAMEKYEKYHAQELIREFQQTQRQLEVQRELTNKLNAVKERYPDAEEKITHAAQSVMRPEMPAVIRAMFDDSEVLPELLYALSDEVTLDNFVQTAKTNPGKAIRALTAMETEIANAAKQPKEEKKPEPKQEVPVPKTNAPKPPSEVGGRGTATDDAAASAAKANDYRTYKAEMNRRDAARLK